LKLGKAIEILERLFAQLLRVLDIFYYSVFFNYIQCRRYGSEKRSGIIVLNDESTMSVTELVTTH
jgi:hypothetical protein